MSFSDILKKRPDLKGTFDVIKITAVTPYMGAVEMRHVAAVANQLLKKGGCLMIELPFDIKTEAFQAHHTSVQQFSAKLNRDGNKLNNTAIAAFSGDKSAKKWMARHSRMYQNKMEAFHNSYRKLLKLHFADITEIPRDKMTGAPIIIAKKPRDHIPPVSDIAVNFTTGEVTLQGEAQKIWMQMEQGNGNSTGSVVEPDNLAKRSSLFSLKPQAPLSGGIIPPSIFGNSR